MLDQDQAMATVGFFWFAGVSFFVAIIVLFVSIFGLIRNPVDRFATRISTSLRRRAGFDTISGSDLPETVSKGVYRTQSRSERLNLRIRR